MTLVSWLLSDRPGPISQTGGQIVIPLGGQSLTSGSITVQADVTASGLYTVTLTALGNLVQPFFWTGQPNGFPIASLSVDGVAIGDLWVTRPNYRDFSLYNISLSSGTRNITIAFTQNTGGGVVLFLQTLTLTPGAAVPPPPSPTPPGPFPLPQPYPIQPGFTPISALSQITGPGNYQLTGNDPTSESLQSLTNVVIDGAGFSVGTTVTFFRANNVTVKNINTGQIFCDFCVNTNFFNCTSNGQWVLLDSNACSFTNCLSDNSADDATEVAANNNVGLAQDLTFDLCIFKMSGDTGIEGVGWWDNASFADCMVSTIPGGVAFGGWFNWIRGNQFWLVNSTFVNCRADAATVGGLFHFTGVNGGPTLNSDALAIPTWPSNLFAGNVFA